jgi:elongation factor P--(R)-beta-lysine ligase
MNLGHMPDVNAAFLRADLLRKVRDFFSHRKVLEVETPVLSRGISLDCHIDVFSAEYYPLGFSQPDSISQRFFLQTSPEPHMKRLLCQGFPDIFQICRAFRNGEHGRFHNPEFTMLEWYRLGFSMEKLMREVEAICQLFTTNWPVTHLTYVEAFHRGLAINPLDFDLAGLSQLPALAGKLPVGHTFQTKTEALDYLMAHVIEPGFPKGNLTFVHAFPAEQAAQAQVMLIDPRLAYRFEVYGGGMELGNGYLELVDPFEYEARFRRENDKRRAYGKPELPEDQSLLHDLKRGLPPCAGVAMGFDRLLSLSAQAQGISGTLNFPWETC